MPLGRVLWESAREQRVPRGALAQITGLAEGRALLALVLGSLSPESGHTSKAPVGIGKTPELWSHEDTAVGSNRRKGMGTLVLVKTPSYVIPLPGGTQAA